MPSSPRCPAGDLLKAGAVSETIGAIVLISVAAIAVGIILLVLYSSPLPTNIPAFTGLISNTSNTVYISHEGGDSLYVGQFQILANYGGKMGVDETANFTKSLSSNVFSLGMRMNATLPANVTHIAVIYNSSWGGGSVLLEADLQGVIPLTPPGWFSPYWLYRKKIVIDHTKVMGSLTGFPILINRADANVGNEAQQPSGNDILFTAWDGTTKLSHEFESYNWNTGSMIVWIKVPSVSPTTDTVIYMYYGNPAASNQQDPTGVWAPNYVGVWHLGEGAGATRMDSTANHNNLASVNNVGSAGGQIGNGATFSAASLQNLTITDAASTGLDITGPITLEAWAKTTVTGGAPYQILEKNKDFGGSCPGGSPPYILRMINGNGAFASEYAQYAAACGGPASPDISGTPTSLTAGTWYFLASTYDGSQAVLYKNGAQTNSTAYASGMYASPGDFNIGSGNGNNYFFTGSIDEARVSNVARTLPWLQTEYNDDINPAVGGFLLSVSNEQTPLTMS